MTKEVHYKRRDGIAVLTLDRPVGNVLAPGLRADLKQQLEKAIADEAVTGIVLNGAGSGFSSGVDITEYEGPLADPWVGDICNLIELGPKPVVAALHGAALGGGFELALAAHARVAASGTRVALGDVNLGLIPGSGATQRAPRLVGAQVALEFMLSGKAVDVANPRMRQFFDHITESDPLEAAIELAASLAASGRWGRTRDQMRGLSDAEAYQKAITSAFERTGGKDGAKNDIVKCVQAAQLLPIESGLVFERTTFEERLRSDDARGQLHIFAAERRAAIMPELAKGPGMQVRSVALTGIAPIVPELVIAFWDAGLQVHLASADADGVRAMVGRIHQMYKAARDDRLSNLAKRPDPAAADGVDVVLDCGGPAPEGDQPKMKPEAIRVTLEGRQGETDLAVRVYRPANTSRLVEVILPEAGYRREDVASLVQMFKKMGRTVVRSARRAGGAGHAMANALYAGALSLVEAGHTPYEVDETARRIGFASGPFELMDKEGLPDVLARLRKGGFTDHLAALTGRIDKGATGYAAGRGFYEYAPEGPRAIPQLLQRLSDPAQKLAGVSAGAALLAALANAAARLLTEDVVQRATDLDVIMVKGYGFARAGGGPLLQSDLRGAFGVLKDMKALSGLSSAVWAPHPLIENMVKNGEGFFGRASGMG